jgi:cytochrome c peroxidase
MKNKSKFKILLFFFTVAFFVGLPLLSKTQNLLPEEELGKLLFFDQRLSVKNNQSCATCHASTSGWTGPVPGINLKGAVYPGSIKTRFGNRKPPTAAYAGDSPLLYYNKTDEVWVGGMFWDGRATGWKLGDPLAEQAQGPFLNPLEQALPDASDVVDRVCISKYADLFRKVCGADICGNVPAAYECIARSIAAYERSPEVSQFTSKYDAFLQGKAQLTAQEALGLELFNGKAMCSACHISDGPKPLFTDFTYDNLGVPRNPKNPFYFEPKWNPDGLDWVDTGLGGFLQSGGYNSDVYDLEWGKQKVPTLRNVDKRPGPGFVKAYGHNGYFKSLKGIVNFYNTRDVKPPCPDPFTTEKDAMAQGCWPAPEVPDNVNSDELGNLGLTEVEEDAIVAFMGTLSDGFRQ